MATATYNGWTNRATWNVALWFDNDEGLYNCRRVSAPLTWRGLAWTAATAKAFALDTLGANTPDGDALADVPRAGWAQIARAWNE